MARAKDCACRLWSPCREWDLRFADKLKELQFKACVKRRLITSTLAVNSIYLGGYILWALEGELEVANLNFDDGPRALRSHSARLFMLVLPLLSFILGLLSLRCGVRCVNWEAVAILTAVMANALVPWCNAWTAATLFGQDPYQTWEWDPSGGEALNLLIMDSVTTGICLFSPARMVYKWIVPVVGILSYSISIAIVGSPHTYYAKANCLVLAVLSVCATWGAWVNEQVARHNFLAQGLVRKKSYELELHLAEMSSFEILLTMVCDATFWLKQDGNTVHKCDPRFDTLLGSPMQGKTLSACLIDDERVRLLDALERARYVPTLVSTSITPHCSQREQLNADFFIVHHESSSTGASDTGAASMPTFLVGVRMSGSHYGSQHGGVSSKSSSAFAKFEALEMLDRVQSISTCTEVGPTASMETTSTGAKFKAIGACRQIDDNTAEGMHKHHFEELVKMGSREKWLINAQDVHMRAKEILGSGSFGVVVAATLYGTQVAVKVARKAEDCLQAKELFVVGNELRILRHVRHPNIILFFGAYIDVASEEICLVLERITGKQLGKYIAQLKEGTQLYIRWQLILDVAHALRYLHSQRPTIVHGDLKGGNIIVDSFVPRAKLLDFGLARVLTKSAQPMGGSLKWMAPEVILIPHSRPRPSTDVFSFGRVVYMVLSGKQPLENFTRATIFEMTKAGQTMPLIWPDGMLLKKPCLELCEKTSDFDQSHRPTMAELDVEISGWDAKKYEHKQEAPLAPLFLTRMTEILPSGDLHDHEDEQDTIQVVRDTMNANAATQESKQRLSSSSGEDLTQPASISRLILPNRKCTEISAKMVMLTMQVMQWNFPIVSGSCCTWHAAISDMHCIVQKLWQRPCSAAFMPHARWQCQTCGVVDMQNQCSICVSSSLSSSTGSSLNTIVEEPLVTNKCSL